MKANEMLHNLSWSIGLDGITCDMLDGGTLKRYMEPERRALWLPKIGH